MRAIPESVSLSAIFWNPAKELGLKTVAEGVETRGYVEYLKSLGCDYIQGYVFYRPMPVEEFEERFLKNGERAQV